MRLAGVRLVLRGGGGGLHGQPLFPLSALLVPGAGGSLAVTVKRNNHRENTG
jgi:hypothetical protein